MSQSDEFSSLDFSFDYFSNTSTFGQFNQIATQPSYSPSISYFYKSGIYASVVGNIVENSDTSFSGTTTDFDLNIGYTKELGKYFTIFPTYTRYFHTEGSNSLISTFSDNFSLDISANIKNIYGGLNANYLIGDNNEWFFTGYLSYSFDYENLGLQNSYLFIQPEVNFNSGNQTYYSNYLWSNIQNNPDYLQEFLDSDQVIRRLNYYERHYPDATIEDILKMMIANNLTQEDDFNLSSIGVNIPASYMIGNFIISASYSLYFLTNKPDYIEENIETYLSFGIIYSISFP